jgi:hypothetical protein
MAPAKGMEIAYCSWIFSGFTELGRKKDRHPS